MSSRSLICAWALYLLLGAVGNATAADGETVRRYLLAAGANSGGPDRILLKYAVTDAEKFARVLTTMGGVEDGDRILLADPDLTAFRAALTDLRQSAAQAGGRTEVVLYYSGHADEDGLLLGQERLSYRELRDTMDGIDADVRITILDACASGAITRMKGGQKRQAFLVDSSVDTRGYAFLTSSSADEAAQESDAIGSSFFTHYLVSGMVGAADVTGEGTVTLGEAYQFAFHETLASTTDSQGGSQHPAYDINLSGTGDLVLTDVREIDAGLYLSEELSGRFYIRNGRQELVAELYKPAGRGMELGLEPGSYEIHMERKEDLFLTTPTLLSGDRLVLTERNFEPTERRATIPRGSRQVVSSRVLPRPLAGRFRLEVGIGAWGTQPRDFERGSSDVNVRVGTSGLVPQFRFSRWMEETVSIGLSIQVLEIDVSADLGPSVSARSSAVTSILADLRHYVPLPEHPYARPYLTVGVGAHVGSDAWTAVDSEVTTSATGQGAFAAQVGAGIDLPLGDLFLLGAKAAYNVVSDFDEPIGGRKDYGGPELGVGISVILGRSTH